MSQITTKYDQLKAKGLDLGTDLHPGAPDMDAGFGGVFREYQNGNIYFHPGVSPEAHEVHGGILSLYLKHGGPKFDPTSGNRMFGFPKTDETSDANGTPFSAFETGSIYWTQGTGGVVVSGEAFNVFASGGGGDDIGLGYPLMSNISIAGGEAIYCERGVAWASNSVPSTHVVGRIYPPLLGTPAVVDPTWVEATRQLIAGVTDAHEPALANIFVFDAIARATYDALVKAQPGFFQMLWANRLSLITTGSRASRIPLSCVITSAPPPANSTDSIAVIGKLEIEASSTAKLSENTLYDIEMAIQNTTGYYSLSPHAVYVKSDWTDFGLLHITDLHVSLTNENFRQRLIANGFPETAGSAESIAGYANCQDRLRDFIKYANHLHSIGLANAIVATGDLVDHGHETGDPEGGPGNYGRFRNMILGKPFDNGVAAGEELLLPIFTTFGNHDWRPNPYDLLCQLGISSSALKSAVEAGIAAGTILSVAGELLLGPLGVIGGIIAGIWGGEEAKDATYTLANYSTFNLEEEEVKKLQGGVPMYGFTDYSKPLSFLEVGSSFPYFDKYFGRRNNKVALGPHRLVLLDSGGDSGVPKSAKPEDLPGLLLNYIGHDLSSDTLELLNGCPNSVGYNDGQLDLLRGAIAEAGSKGLVIVGVHLPPLAPTHGYNDYMRETEHPTAPPIETANYLSATGINKDGWTTSGTPYYKTGTVEQSLAYGIGTGKAQDLINICAGVNARPIDLLLCGHHHDRIEYRLRWNPANSQIEYYMDFYSENPDAFYASSNFSEQKKDGKDGFVATNFHVLIDKNAKLNGETGAATGYDVNGNAVVYNTLRVPPYADPLNSSNDTATWWQNHRPLLVQTSALGPIDPCQRVPGQVGDPTFQGFRMIVVRSNGIHRIRYVTDAELLQSNFVLPWEQEDSLPLIFTTRAVSAV